MRSMTAGDVELRLDIHHGATLEHRVVVTLLDDFFDCLIQLGFELLEHVTVSDGLRLVQPFD